MNHLPFRSVLAALAAAVCALSLAACDGHDSRSSSDNASNGATSTAAAPDFDASGAWTAHMDDITLGITSFDMSSSGHLSGSARPTLAKARPSAASSRAAPPNTR